MTYRLWYIITWPSAILASIFAYWMLFFTDLGKACYKCLDACKTWLYLHCICTTKMPTNFQSIANDQIKYSTNFMRLWNDATSFFFAVFLVILKNAVNWIYGVIGIFIFHLQSC
jgi:putative membrane protein